MAAGGFCRWCGRRAEPGFLDCAACDGEIQPVLSGSELHAAVAAWVMDIEGVDTVRGRRVEDIDPGERL